MDPEQARHFLSPRSKLFAKVISRHLGSFNPSPSCYEKNASENVANYAIKNSNIQGRSSNVVKVIFHIA